jgi:hypothetical protein
MSSLPVGQANISRRPLDQRAVIIAGAGETVRHVAVLGARAASRQDGYWGVTRRCASAAQDETPMGPSAS